MTALNKKTCVPCSGNSPPILAAAIARLKPQIPEWTIIHVNDQTRLQRVYKFRDFKIALNFTQQVGEAAENDGHHPALLTEWGQVTVTWWTHAIGGLHSNDFIMAAKTDQIATELSHAHP